MSPYKRQEIWEIQLTSCTVQYIPIINKQSYAIKFINLALYDSITQTSNEDYIK